MSSAAQLNDRLRGDSFGLRRVGPCMTHFAAMYLECLGLLQANFASLKIIAGVENQKQGHKNRNRGRIKRYEILASCSSD